MSDILRRRTEAGAGLRLDLERLVAEVPTVPPGKRGRVSIGYEDGQGEIGAAWLTDRGWEVGGAVSAAVKNGRSVRAVGSITW